MRKKQSNREERLQQYYYNLNSLKIGVYGPFGKFETRLLTLRTYLRDCSFLNTKTSKDFEYTIEGDKDIRGITNADIRNRVITEKYILHNEIHILVFHNELEIISCNSSVLWEFSRICLMIQQKNILPNQVMVIVHKNNMKRAAGSFGSLVRGCLDDPNFGFEFEEYGSNFSDSFSYVIGLGKV